MDLEDSVGFLDDFHGTPKSSHCGPGGLSWAFLVIKLGHGGLLWGPAGLPLGANTFVLH